MNRLLATLVFIFSAVSVSAQSIFVNDKVQSGTTCPPVNIPGGGAGTLYTCTGTGALYTWTGSLWSAVGSGTGTLSGTIAATQIAVGSGADTIGGSNDFIRDSSGNVQLFSSNSSTMDYLLDVVSESSSSADPEQAYPRMLHSIFNFDGTGHIVNKRVIPLDGEAFNNSTGRIEWSSSAELYAENISTGTWGDMIGAGARLFNDDTGTVTNMVGFQTSPQDHFGNGNYGGGTITSYTAFEGNGVNDNGTYGAVYGLHLISQVGLTVTGNNHAINYNDTFVVDSLGQIVDGINASAVPDVDSSIWGDPTLAGAAGNVSNGTHRYKITYENTAATFHTGSSGAPSAAVTVVNNAANGQVTVHVPAQIDGYYSRVRVYRDKDSDGVYKLVGAVSFGQKTLVDNVADGSLGVTIPATNNTLVPRLSFSNGMVSIPATPNGDNFLLFKSIGGTDGFSYIWLEPEDRLNSSIPIKGWLLFGNYNTIPASLDYAEGGQIGAQGGQDAAGGYGFVYGGAAFTSNTDNFMGGAYLLMHGGTATAGGALEMHSGSAFTAGDSKNGGDGLIEGGVFAAGGHLGDLTIDSWRNIAVTGAGTLTLTPAGSFILAGSVSPASSGTRFLCISTAGVVTSSASVCSGT